MREKIRKDYLENKISINKICKKYNISVTKFYTYVGKNETRSVSESMKIYRLDNDIKMSDETKLKISKSLKKAHMEGRHTGWSHINSDISRRSYPEKFFYEFLLSNGFFDKYYIIEKLSIGKYFLDFALINKKIDIEIDGDQHFRNNKAINHDKKRDQYMNNEGWVVYRVKWKDLCNNYDKEIKEFRNYLNKKEIKNRFYEKEISVNTCGCGAIILKTSKNCRTCVAKKRKVERPSYNQLLKDLNETNYSAVGRKYGVSDNSIRKWLKKYQKLSD